MPEITDPDSKVHGANMGPIWGDRTQVGPMSAPWTLFSGEYYGACEYTIKVFFTAICTKPIWNYTGLSFYFISYWIPYIMLVLIKVCHKIHTLPSTDSAYIYLIVSVVFIVIIFCMLFIVGQKLSQLVLLMENVTDVKLKLSHLLS